MFFCFHCGKVGLNFKLRFKPPILVFGFHYDSQFCEVCFILSVLLYIFNSNEYMYPIQTKWATFNELKYVERDRLEYVVKIKQRVQQLERKTALPIVSYLFRKIIKFSYKITSIDFSRKNNPTTKLGRKFFSEHSRNQSNFLQTLITRTNILSVDTKPNEFISKFSEAAAFFPFYNGEKLSHWKKVFCLSA